MADPMSAIMLPILFASLSNSSFLSRARSIVDTDPTEWSSHILSVAEYISFVDQSFGIGRDGESKNISTATFSWAVTGIQVMSHI